jgi:HEAT repeat protein
MTINAAWHTRHRMPGRPTLQQRIAWHIEHEQNCGCRPMPSTLRPMMSAAGVRPPAGETKERNARLLGMLKGGDRRSIGRADVVARIVMRQPRLLPLLIDGMADPDPLVRMRAADAAEKATRQHPEWLVPHKRRLLGDIAASNQAEVRWHIAQMLSRLRLGGREERQAFQILLHYLEDESRIVRVSSMQALADLALQDPMLNPRVVPLLKKLTRTGSAAMRSRGRRLLAR